jgi:hypothetical protein
MTEKVLSLTGQDKIVYINNKSGICVRFFSALQIWDEDERNSLKKRKMEYKKQKKD